ncbi:TPA: DUF551 domain-containing protein [Pseudomonas aeruginosa]|nr:DUF551 domain-containing protein [Pseudomonas aeruginosa]
MDDWIRVEDRMPTPNKTVLAYRKGHRLTAPNGKQHEHRLEERPGMGIARADHWPALGWQRRYERQDRFRARRFGRQPLRRPGRRSFLCICYWK